MQLHPGYVKSSSVGRSPRTAVLHAVAVAVVPLGFS